KLTARFHRGRSCSVPESILLNSKLACTKASDKYGACAEMMCSFSQVRQAAMGSEANSCSRPVSKSGCQATISSDLLARSWSGAMHIPDSQWIREGNSSKRSWRVQKL